MRDTAWFSDLVQKLSLPTLALEDAFPGITFSSPLDFQPSNDGSGRVFIVEQGGTIWSVSSSGSSFTKTKVLDISTLTSASGERGLLGLAVHPKFSTNGFVFVNFTDKASGDTRISRFTLQAGVEANASSEVRLLEVTQPFANHNGGSLAFGSDGKLYIGLGDGGSGGDPMGNGQNKSTLLGKILRIDVEIGRAHV